MLPVTIIFSMAAVTIIVALAFFGADALGAQRWGRVALLVGLVALPLLVSAANISYGTHESSQTGFCLSCHEMQRYGQTLFADNRFALSAVHYQNRLVEREQACFTCHTNYGLFGDAKAKLNGLRHVWAHYIGGVPKTIALYQPYPSQNCLHCHDDARRFQEAPAHQPVLSDLYSGKKSCLACHSVAHDMTSVAAHRLWQVQE